MSDSAPRPDSSDPLRYIIASDTRKEIEHIVDLGAWQGVGECSCEFFQFKILPELRTGNRGEGLRCKHINRARSSFADSMIARIIQVQPRENSESQR